MHQIRIASFRALLLTSSLLALASPAALATTYTFNSPSSSSTTWSAGTDWNAAPQSGSATSLVFNMSGATNALFTPAAPQTINTVNDVGGAGTGTFLLNNLTLGGATSATAGSTATVTISGNPLDFVANGAVNPTVSLLAHQNGTSQLLVYNINNNLILSNDTTFTGTTTTSANFRFLGSITGPGAMNIAAGSGTVTLGGATLDADLNDHYAYNGNININSGALAGNFSGEASGNNFFSLSDVTIGATGTLEPSGAFAIGRLDGSGTLAGGSLYVNYVGASPDVFTGTMTSSVGGAISSVTLAGDGILQMGMFGSAAAGNVSGGVEGVSASGVLIIQGTRPNNASSVVAGGIALNAPYGVVETTGTNGIILGTVGDRWADGTLWMKPVTGGGILTGSASGTFSSTVIFQQATIILDSGDGAGMTLTVGGTGDTGSVFSTGGQAGALIVQAAGGLDSLGSTYKLTTLGTNSVPILTNGIAGAAANSTRVGGGPNMFAADTDANQTGDFMTYIGNGSNTDLGFFAFSNSALSGGSGDGLYNYVNSFTTDVNGNTTPTTGGTGTGSAVTGGSVVDITTALSAPITITSNTSAYALRITGTGPVNPNSIGQININAGTTLTLGDGVGGSVAGLILNGGVISGTGTLSSGLSELEVYTSLANGTISAPIVGADTGGGSNNITAGLTKTGPGTLFIKAPAIFQSTTGTKPFGVIGVNEGALDVGTINTTTARLGNINAGSGLRLTGGVLEGNGTYGGVVGIQGLQQPSVNGLIFSSAGGGFAAYGTGALGSAGNNLTVSLNAGHSLVWGGDGLATTTSTYTNTSGTFTAVTFTGTYTSSSSSQFFLEVGETNNGFGSATLVFGSNVSDGTVNFANNLQLGLTTDSYYRDIYTNLGTGSDSVVFSGSISDTASATGTVLVTNSTGTVTQAITVSGIGVHGILKDGEGSMVTTGNNTYNGLTQVGNGGLYVDGINGTATAGTQIAGAGVGQGSYTISPMLTTSSVTFVNGTGTLATPSQYSYFATFGASAGTQQVANGAILGGNGSIGLLSGASINLVGASSSVMAHLAPGLATSVGTPTIGTLMVGTAGNGNSVNLGKDTSLDVYFDANTANAAQPFSLLNVNGTFNIAGATGDPANLNLIPVATDSAFLANLVGNASYTIVATTGGVTGTFNNAANDSILYDLGGNNGANFIVNYSTGSITVTDLPNNFTQTVSESTDAWSTANTGVSKANWNAGNGAPLASGQNTSVDFETGVTLATAQTFTSNNDVATGSTVGSDTNVFQLNNLTLAGTTTTGTSSLSITGNALDLVSSSTGILPTINLNGTNMAYSVANDLILGNNTTIQGGASAGSYRFGGAISGGGSLTDASPAQVILTGAETFTGATTINTGGHLQLGDGTAGHNGTLGGTSSITNNGSLAFDRADNTTVAQVISGSGTVTTSGSGTLSFTNANTYGGGTTVAAGTLLANNTTAGGSATGSGSVTVNGGATLGGHGSITGTAITVAGSGTAANQRANILVGLNSASDTSVSSQLTLQGTSAVISNANLTFNINTAVKGGLGTNPTNSGTELNVGATAVAFSGQTTLTLNLQNTGIISGFTPYVLVAGIDLNQLGASTSQYSGLVFGTSTGSLADGLVTQILGSGVGQNGDLTLALTGAGVNNFYAANSYLFLYQNASGVDDIEVEVVPEPGTWSLLLGGLLCLGWVIRRRRNNRA